MSVIRLESSPSRLTERGGSRSSRSAGRDAVDAGDAASRGERGCPTPGRDTVAVPEFHWRGGAVAPRNTTDPAQRTAGERISSVRPKSRRPRSNAWIMNGVPSNGASARGYRGASRKPTACGTPVVPVVRKSWRIVVAEYGARPGPRVHRAPGVPRALFREAGGECSKPRTRKRRENAKAWLFDI